jgi:hypothetical protein
VSWSRGVVAAIAWFSVCAAATQQSTNPPPAIPSSPSAQPAAAPPALKNRFGPLLYEGRRMRPDTSQVLEAKVKADPDNLDDRARLLGFYFTTAKQQMPLAQVVATRRQHILWLIENHPGSELLQTSETTIDPAGHDLADPEGYGQARAMFMKQIDTHPRDVAVLTNAGFFFKLPDKALAERALLAARAADPHNPQADLMLAMIYSMALLGVEGMSNTGIPTKSNEAAAQGEFARGVRERLDKSQDHELLGMVGVAVSNQAVILARLSPNPAVHQASAYAESLLIRANQMSGGKYSYALGSLYYTRSFSASNADERLALEKKAFELEQTAAAELEKTSWRVLESLAALALEIGDQAAAGKYADALMNRVPAIPEEGMRGQVLHKAHIFAGRLELAKGNIDAAKEHLLAAGRVQEAVTLSSFGPNMSLAKELLEHGQKDVVLQYLDQCAKFWTMGGQRLAKWKQEIEAGNVPEFGANLTY